jgi:aryl-alcohol dehydrogenase-like predicted oxidoreductase
MRTLGKDGPSVCDVGLGCMGMSDLYGPADDTESKATIHAALDAGVTLLDTGDYYGMGHNELLIRDALIGRNRRQVVISVKCGALRDPEENWLGMDGRPAAVKTFLAYSLRRLGTDWIDIYRLGRVDSAVRSRTRSAQCRKWSRPLDQGPFNGSQRFQKPQPAFLS